MLKRTHTCGAPRAESCRKPDHAVRMGEHLPRSGQGPGVPGPSRPRGACARWCSIWRMCRPRWWPRHAACAARTASPCAARFASAPATRTPRLATGEVELLAKEIEVFNKAQDLPILPDEHEADKINEETRLKYRYIDLRRPRMPADPAHALQGDQAHARLLRRQRLHRDRDAPAHQEHAGGRARLHRAGPPASRTVVRAAAEPAAVQADPDGGRLRALPADLPLPARRGSARRPSGGVHADRPGDELRRPRGRDAGDGRVRPRRVEGCAGLRHRHDRAHDLAGIHGALRHRPPGPALRPRDPRHQRCGARKRLPGVPAGARQEARRPRRRGEVHPRAGRRGEAHAQDDRRLHGVRQAVQGGRRGGDQGRRERASTPAWPSTWSRTAPRSRSSWVWKWATRC